MDETLILVWGSSLVLAAAALIWMSALIVGRVLRTRRDAARDKDRVAVRDACLAVLARGPEAAPELVALAHRPRLIAEVLMDFVSLVRGSEFSDLVATCQQTGIDEALRKRVFQGSRAGRMAAIEALALFPARETVEALNRVLDRVRDNEVCMAALRTLVELGQAPPLQYLVWAFSSAPVASQDHVLITRRAIEQQPDVALELLNQPGQPARARILLADGLGAAGDYRAIGPLGELSQDPDQAVRTEAIRSLGLLGHPASMPILIKALTDSHWGVRAVACEACARIGGSESVRPMTQLLGDPVWWVRFEATEALFRLGPVGMEALIQSTGSDDDRIRRMASLALQERAITPPKQVESV